MAACNHEINFAAVRAYYRAWHPVENSYTDALYYDSGFDAGEFSGPAIARMYERDQERITKRVADAFGITADELDRMVTCHAMHEQDILISKGLY